MERMRPYQQSVVQDRPEAKKPQLSPLVLAFYDNIPQKICSSAVGPGWCWGAGAPGIERIAHEELIVSWVPRILHLPQGYLLGSIYFSERAYGVCGQLMKRGSVPAARRRLCRRLWVWKHLLLPKGIRNTVPRVLVLSSLQANPKTSYAFAYVAKPTEGQGWGKSTFEWQPQRSSRRTPRGMWTVVPGDHSQRGKLIRIFLSPRTAWFLKEAQPLRSHCLPICTLLYYLWNSPTDFNQLWARCSDCKDN